MKIVTDHQNTSVHIELPRKLYGRLTEIEMLRTAFWDASQGQQVSVFISGYAGMGKTALVYEAIHTLDLQGGYFVSGKSDQLGQNIPYAPIAAALSNLVKQLMTESQEDLNRWKKRISRTLGRNGKVVTELVPELKWIVGEQPDIDALPPSEAQHRFRLVLRGFISAITGYDRPLVFFLDDLQWADPASVQILQFLIRDADLPYLLLIGAYRETEAKENYALVQLLESCGQTGSKERRFVLTPLAEEQSVEWIAETLSMSSVSSVPLALALHRKSWGNPFFFRQLLISLYDDGFLFFSDKNGQWQWDQSTIQTLQPGEDVLEFLTERLKKLPDGTLSLLKFAACMGNSFHLEALALITGNTLEIISSNMQSAILEGLVIEKEREMSRHIEAPVLFEFLHDRVQQVLYALIPEATKKEMHVMIGRLLLCNTPADSLEERILSIMDHFNRSLDLILDPTEKLDLAGYNLMAGCKAKAATAYDSARQYFRAGLALLPEDSWNSCYRLSFDLHMEQGQCEYMSGDVQTAELLFDAALKYAQTAFERADVCSLKMLLYAGVGKYTQAVQTGIDALGQFGIRLNTHPMKLDFARELLLYKLYMRGRKAQALADLPEISHPTQKKIAEFLIRLACVSSTSYTDLYALICIMAGNHAVKYGNSEMASIGYIGYSIVEGSILGNYTVGEELGNVSMRLSEKYDRSFSKCIVYFTVGAIISHWTQHGRTGIEYMRKAAEYGVEAGDVLIIGYAHSTVLENRYLLGTPLPKIAEEARECRNEARRLKHEAMDRTAAIYQCLTAALVGQANSDGEAALAEQIKDDKVSLVCYHFSRLQRRYLFGDYLGALFEAEKMNGVVDAIMGFMLTAEGNFYHSLAIAAAYEELTPKERKQYDKILKNNQKQMKRWAESCKQNFLHKYLLICAETARLENRQETAMALYDQAIQEARDNGYRQNEALACELAARFYLAQGRIKIAGVYMEDAYFGYREWGAFVKAETMREQYDELLKRVANAEKPPILFAETTASDSEIKSEQNTQGIDALHQAILMMSRQEEPSDIFGKFLNVAIESAHADKGILMLEREGKLWIEETIVDGVQIPLAGGPISMEKSSGFSKAIVRYVFRTLEKASWNLSDISSVFMADAYAQKSGVKAIVCLPILFRGIPAGVLYLENNRDEGAFASVQMGQLELLSEQLVTVKKLQAYLEGNANMATRIGGTLTEPLTGREAQVLRLIASGMSNKEIADTLQLTVNTVKGYIKNIYGKMGVNRRVQVAAKAKGMDIKKIK